MFPLLFNVYMDAVIKKVKMGMERMGVTFLEEGRGWRLPSLSYTDGLVLCGESEEDLKVNADKSKLMVLCEEDGLVCEALVNGM